MFGVQGEYAQFSTKPTHVVGDEDLPNAYMDQKQVEVRLPGDPANAATGVKLKDELSQKAMPTPKINTDSDGKIIYSYGSLSQGQGLDASLSPDGVLRIEVKSGARREQYGSGADMFDEMMRNVSSRGKVEEILGQWSNAPGLSDNYDSYLKNLAANGGNKIAAAAETWTGKQAARYGYVPVSVDSTGAGGFEVKFKKVKP